MYQLVFNRNGPLVPLFEGKYFWMKYQRESFLF